MATVYVLYNLKAGFNTSINDITILDAIFDDELKYIDIEKIKDYKVFISGLEKDDCIAICGGDGTLNRFINDIDGITLNNKVYYYPVGTGNDFATDLDSINKKKLFDVTEYIRDLPFVTVNGKTCRFLNGIGYGIDGYCCEVGDELKKTAKKPINYTAIAIKGLLFHYKPTKATVTVDGQTRKYDKVWIAPTMNGRYYGGGMMPTPEQKRTGKNRKLSVMIFHDSGRLRTLMIFPGIFKGEHVKHKKYVDILTGNDISVEFDRPVALQIDGETVLNVSKYSAKIQ